MSERTLFEGQRESERAKLFLKDIHSQPPILLSLCGAERFAEGWNQRQRQSGVLLATTTQRIVGEISREVKVDKLLK